MTINEVRSIILAGARKKGYYLEERKSVSTGSWYFKLYSGDNTSLLFRVSDHKTKADVITLRIDHKLTRDMVIRFINNRCSDLGARHLKLVLGM